MLKSSDNYLQENQPTSKDMKALGRKREAITLSTKVEIIRKIETGRNQADVGNEYSVAKSTIATIWKKRDKILNAYKHNFGNAKRLRRPKRDDVDDALIRWVTLQRKRNGAITGPILQAKAEAFAKFLDDGEFRCSLGWLSRFKKRYSITCNYPNNNVGIDTASVEYRNWFKNVWPVIRRDYSDNDIFSAVETGLFFNLTPDEMFKYKDDKCERGKHAKDRLTVMMCANMLGSEKRKLVVIGKSQHPRSLSNVKHLPVNYRANKNSWMTADIFIEELVLWDLELQNHKRKILLLVDDTPCHPCFEHLDCIKLVFIPSNPSSRVLPKHQNLVRSLKFHFRKALILHVIDCLQKKMNVTISILDAVRFLDKSWCRITCKTIQHSFYKAGLLTEEISNDDEDDIPLSVWLRKYKMDQFVAWNELDLYVDVDDDVLTSEKTCISKTESPDTLPLTTSSNSDTDDVDVGNSEEAPVVSVCDAMQAIRTVSLFFETQDVDQDVRDSILKIDNAIEKIFSSKPKL